jgi:hypothetical protein
MTDSRTGLYKRHDLDGRDTDKDRFGGAACCRRIDHLTRPTIRS